MAADLSALAAYSGPITYVSLKDSAFVQSEAASSGDKWSGDKGHKIIYGKAFIYSKQNDYDIYIDEELIGKTPVLVDSIKYGKHVVEAYAGNELVFRKTIAVKDISMVIIGIKNSKEVASTGL